MINNPCPFCDLVRDHNHPTFICEFSHAVSFVDFEQQDYPGAAILILKDHHEHIYTLPRSLSHAFDDNRAQVSAAIFRAFPDVIRMNYANLGNGIPHIHEYVIPRRANDKNAGRSPWPIIPTPKLSDEEYRNIALKIRAAL
jgi:histidine triad (HIT) family protein